MRKGEKKEWRKEKRKGRKKGWWGRMGANNYRKEKEYFGLFLMLVRANSKYGRININYVNILPKPKQYNTKTIDSKQCQNILRKVKYSTQLVCGVFFIDKN